MIPYAPPLPRTRTFVDVRSWVFWVMVALALYAYFEVAPLVAGSFLGNPAAAALAALVWAVYGAVFAVAMYRLELFERRSVVTVVGALVWGAIVAIGVSRVGGPAMHTIVEGWVGEDSPWVTALAAPPVEEPLKALGVVALALIPGARIRTVADGVFYGAAVGLGFQVVESFVYTARTAALSDDAISTVWSMVVLRGFASGLWSHATFSAIAGAGVAYFFVSARPWWRRVAVMLAALGAAMVVHGLLNAPVLLGSPFASALLKGVPILAMLLVVLRVTHRLERAIFAMTARDIVPDDLVSPADFALLRSRTERRLQREEMALARGPHAARALHDVQRAQLALLAAAHTDGMASARAADAVGDLLEARAFLSVVA